MMRAMLSADTKKRLKILLVEDDDIDATVLEAMSRQSPNYVFHFTRATCFQAAQQAMTEDSFDIYVVDYWLRGSSTFALLGQMSAETCKTPTIILSSITSFEAAQLGIGDGIKTHFLSKSNLTAYSFKDAVERAMSFH